MEFSNITKHNTGTGKTMSLSRAAIKGCGSRQWLTKDKRERFLAWGNSPAWEEN
jgi:hypothetical protein